MVPLPNSDKLRPFFDPSGVAAAKSDIEDPLDDERGPLNKRSKTAVPHQQDVMHGVVDEPSPLGLRLRKSPSLVDLIQTRLSRANSSAASSFEILEAGRKKELKSTGVSSTTEKMKASNFPLSLLRIGTWERVSKYEGDLVAKCYFAKHKLVWEVLEGGLKSKIEIQWSDIFGLKATCPENGLGNLDIVLERPPLFFRETDPQPRKHTLWQATQDFTNGQASIHRRHFLQCSPGFLSKNFEKIIQCDARLNSLSQQLDIILDPPHFEPQSSVFEDQDDSRCHGIGTRKDDYGATFSGFCESSSFFGNSSMSNKSELRDSVGRTLDFASRDTPSPHSVFESQMMEEKACKEAEGRDTDWWNQSKVPGIRGSASMSDLVNCLGHHISEHTISANSSSSDIPSNKAILEDLTQYLLSDSQFSAASGEHSLISRVNSLCCLRLREDAGISTIQKPHINDSDGWQQDAGSEDEPDDEIADRKPLISRKESFGELLMLPRIASVPQFLFNISEDAKNEDG